ncbi:hypothetical protein N0V84_001439 [Fusarium piperis]|uniref:Uncharacterized protein n=1 Tax=Fusarium piperis TaxID=1435070 RepID=A0A9W9BTV1_9HYPO|nr:hypothetical protein N0V84_001439 [Fusarium piperis]
MGDKWDIVYGYLGEGLLAFIPCYKPINISPFGVNTASYHALAKRACAYDLERLHELLKCEYIVKICQAAKAWLDAVDGGREDVLEELQVEDVE